MFLGVEANAQSTILAGFWNVENLFDTTDAVLIQDDDFTPSGKYAWTEERLSKKCTDLTRVIHELDKNNDLAILGLAEIENKDILDRLNDNFIKRGMLAVHKESPDERGIDCGLLYDPTLVKLMDQQFITVYLAGDEKTRDIIEAEFTFKNSKNQTRLYVFVNHWPSRWGGQQKTDPLRRAAADLLRNRIDQILVKDSRAEILILGDFNDYPDDPSLKDVLRTLPPGPNRYPGDLINTTWSLHENLSAGTVMYRGD